MATVSSVIIFVIPDLYSLKICFFTFYDFRFALNSAFFIASGMSEIRMAEIVERLSFPVPKDQAMQLASMLLSYAEDGHVELDLEQVAMILQSEFY